MRTMLLTAAAGMTALVAAVSPACAQYYGWGYGRPYYVVPYGYDPEPYYAPPPIYDPPAPRVYRHRSAVRLQHRAAPRRQRVMHRVLVNPLLGPLPDASSPRRR